jgi:acyl-CoA reductase-like NAD-dependent aldehyde dehydrogenase
MNPLARLNRQYIGGVWRDGSSKKTQTDKNPYDGKTIADFKLASLSDLDEAYRSAAAAKKIWAEVNRSRRVCMCADRVLVQRSVYPSKSSPAWYTSTTAPSTMIH